jgi:ketosteroid isomerase-like protein
MARVSLLLVAPSLLMAVMACRPASADESDRAAEAVRTADQAWLRAFAGRDTSAAVAAVEPDGSVLAPNAPIATGPDAIRALFAGFYAMPDMNIRWQPSRVAAARSGDMGYSTGPYELTFTGPQRKQIKDQGKYVTVWHKQDDGTWKVVLDIFNSDLAPPKP